MNVLTAGLCAVAVKLGLVVFSGKMYWELDLSSGIARAEYSHI
jgi:hypothetical protein